MAGNLWVKVDGSWEQLPLLPGGGSSGQVLTKTSEADFSADWRTPAPGSGEPVPPIETLPYGATSGKRIVLDGVTGVITFYNDADEVVGIMSPDIWLSGATNGAHTQQDPFGSLRVFDNAGLIAAIIDAQGVSVREPVSGLIAAALDRVGLRLAAQSGNLVELVADQPAQTAPPKWAGKFLPWPYSTSGPTPALTRFTAEDLEVRFICGYQNSAGVVGTWAPPAGFTERYDIQDRTGGNVLHPTMATRYPAVPNSEQLFTFSASGNPYKYTASHTVVLRGTLGVMPDPTVRAISRAFFSRTGTTATIQLAPPTGIVAGDVMVAVVDVSNTGSNGLPVSWSIPDGWLSLGAGFASPSTPDAMLASGTWYKIVTADDVALAGSSGTYTVTINFAGPASTPKKFHASITDVMNVAIFESGADIRFTPASRCRVWSSVDTQMQSNVDVPVDFDKVTYDPGGCFNLATNTYVVPQTGPYMFGWRLHTQAGVAIGERFISYVQVNGVTRSAGTDVVAERVTRQTLMGTDNLDLVEGDLVQLIARQVAGTGRLIDGLNEDGNFFWIQRGLST